LLPLLPAPYQVIALRYKDWFAGRPDTDDSLSNPVEEVEESIEEKDGEDGTIDDEEEDEE
jgi:hypothetical protein